MAGNKRGARGQSRGKGSVSGGGGGTSGVPWSQSGGISRKFAGGGGQVGGWAPGGTAQSKVGKTSRQNGTPINIRTAGGDKGKSGQVGKVKRGTGLERSNGAGQNLTRAYRTPARGRGGSNDT